MSCRLRKDSKTEMGNKLVGNSSPLRQTTLERRGLSPIVFTPPNWLRHITPWWLLQYIDRNYETCWAGMVMWKLGYEFEDSWKIVETCFESGNDYCGKYKSVSKSCVESKS